MKLRPYQSDIININIIKSKIKDFNLNLIELDINHQFQKLNHTINLPKEHRAGNYFRDIWSRFDTIKFVDCPKSLRTTNKVEIYLGGTHEGSVSSFKKEDILRLIRIDRDTDN